LELTSPSLSKANSYRDHARRCVIKAGQAQRTEAKLSWLYMAQTWLGMIPEPQQTAADVIQAAVWNGETRQE
jgi:hypothetical protein